MATLRQRIDTDLKDAMRAKNELATGVLRLLKAAVMNKEVELGTAALDDGQVVQVVATLLKQRRESIEQFRSGGRPDLADREEKESAVLQGFLPAQLSAAELSAEVARAIGEAGAKGARDLGAVMKLLTGRLRGRADGKAISDEAKAQLAALGA